MRLDDMPDYRRLKFRNPYTLNDRDHEDYMLSVSASDAWEDLEYDIQRLVDNPQKEIYDRLDAKAFAFYAGTNNIYNKDGYDYVFRFSEYEEIKINIIKSEWEQDEHQYDGDILDGAIYMYGDGTYVEEIDLGQNDQLSLLWCLSMKWLDEFNGYIDKHTGLIDKDRKQKLKDLKDLLY